MKLSRAQLLAARMPKCKWSEDQITAAVGKRFPGDGDIDLAELIRSWLDDRSLRGDTLYQCASLARKAAKVPAYGARLNPRKCLETVLKAITRPPETENTNG